MNRPEKIKLKLSKDEFICLHKLSNILVCSFETVLTNDEIVIMRQIILTKFYQRASKMLIPIKAVYNFSIDTEVACALFNYLQSYLLNEIEIFERNLIDKIIFQIHKEVIV